MLGTTSHDLPLPMPWRRCANTIGDKWVFASPIAKSRDKNYPASCANASPMYSAGRLDGQSRAYTKLRLADDPAIAFVEISNEDSMLYSFANDQLAAFTDVSACFQG